MLSDQLERLVERGIQLLPLPEVTTHFVFERDGFVALVERKQDAFGGIGSAGLLSERGGFAALVWRGDAPWFVAKGFEQPASPGQIASLREFGDDLEWALRGTDPQSRNRA
jgi:hypothetical protein